MYLSVDARGAFVMCRRDVTPDQGEHQNEHSLGIIVVSWMLCIRVGISLRKKAFHYPVLQVFRMSLLARSTHHSGIKDRFRNESNGCTRAMLRQNSDCYEDTTLRQRPFRGRLRALAFSLAPESHTLHITFLLSGKLPS